MSFFWRNGSISCKSASAPHGEAAERPWTPLSEKGRTNLVPLLYVEFGLLTSNQTLTSDALRPLGCRASLTFGSLLLVPFHRAHPSLRFLAWTHARALHFTRNQSLNCATCFGRAAQNSLVLYKTILKFDYKEKQFANTRSGIQQIRGYDWNCHEKVQLNWRVAF